jgi:hypothetical protein
MQHPAAIPPNDGFFEIAQYIGAFDPVNNWMAQWTAFVLK